MNKHYSKKDFWIQCAIIFIGILLGGMLGLAVAIFGKLPIIVADILIIPFGIMFVSVIRWIVTKKQQ